MKGSECFKNKPSGQKDKNLENFYLDDFLS